MSTLELEEREVRAHDPGLSDEANLLLTAELRAVVGSASVRVPPGTPPRPAHPPAAHTLVWSVLVRHRLSFAMTFAGALVVGAVISLLTGTWWAVVGATALHALSTLLVTTVIIHVTTETEHVAPTTAAKLEAEGITNPDRFFIEMLEEYAGVDEAHGVAEIISTGHNAQPATASEEPLAAAAAQRTAMTPGSAPSRPAGDRSILAVLPWWTTAPVLAACIAVPAILGGGLLWVITGVSLPVCLGWLVLERGMGGDDQDVGDETGPERAIDDTGAALRRRILPISAVVFGGVVGFMIICGALAGVL